MILVQRPDGNYHLFPPGNEKRYYMSKGTLPLGEDKDYNFVQVEMLPQDDGTMEGLLRRIVRDGVPVMIGRDMANRPVMEMRHFDISEEAIERCAVNNALRRERLAKRAHQPSLPQAIMALAAKLGVMQTPEAPAPATGRTKGG